MYVYLYKYTNLLPAVLQAAVTGAPSVFRVLDMHWHAEGEHLLLLSKDRMIGLQLLQVIYFCIIYSFGIHSDLDCFEHA